MGHIVFYKSGTTDKEEKAAFKANCQAIAYLELALLAHGAIEIVDMINHHRMARKRSIKVMTQLQEIHHPNNVQRNFVSLQLVSMHMLMLGRITDDDMIG